MKSKEFMRWLSAQGCTFKNHRGGSGHKTVHLNGRRSTIPMHGSNHELGKGLIHRIKKDLGLNK